MTDQIVNKVAEELPVLTFKSEDVLHLWLMKNHLISEGMWVRVYKKDSGVASVTFEEILDEGLCFGWSESKRIKGDKQSYLQRFTPRRTKGTTSKRNQEHIKRLMEEKKMMPEGIKALGVSMEDLLK
jgi:uncharacterized protein YdeI (YjbR/CyaY-like superfamily)